MDAKGNYLILVKNAYLDDGFCLDYLLAGKYLLATWALRKAKTCNKHVMSSDVSRCMFSTLACSCALSHCKVSLQTNMSRLFAVSLEMMQFLKLNTKSLLSYDSQTPFNFYWKTDSIFILWYVVRLVSVVSLHALLVPMSGFTSYSSFLTQSKNMHARFGESTLTIGVNAQNLMLLSCSMRCFEWSVKVQC